MGRGSCQGNELTAEISLGGRGRRKRAGFMRLSVCGPKINCRVVIHFQFCVQFAELEIGNQAILVGFTYHLIPCLRSGLLSHRQLLRHLNPRHADAAVGHAVVDIEAIRLAEIIASKSASVNMVTPKL